MKGEPSFRGRKTMKNITLKEYAKLLKVSHYTKDYGKLRAKMARKRLEQSSLTAPKDAADRELFFLIKEEIERSNGNIVSFRLAIGQRCENPSHCLMQWTEKYCKHISMQKWIYVCSSFYPVKTPLTGRSFTRKDDQTGRGIKYARPSFTIR